MFKQFRQDCEVVSVEKGFDLLWNWDEGTARMRDQDGGLFVGNVFHLWLAESDARLRREQIEVFFDRGRAAMNDSLTTEQLLSKMCLRVYPHTYFDRHDADVYSERIHDDLLVVVAVDTGDNFLMPGRKHLEATGLTREQVFAKATENTKAWSSFERERQQTDLCEIWNIWREDGLGSSGMVWIEELVNDSLPFGSVVTAPLDGILVEVRLDELNPRLSMSIAARLCRMHWETEGGVQLSSSVYHVLNGVVTPVRVDYIEDGISLELPPVLEKLLPPLR